MKIGQQVVVTEDGTGHYLKRPSLATIVKLASREWIYVNGVDHNDKPLTQLLTPAEYELIEEEA